MENSEKSLPVSQQCENQCFRNARNRPKSDAGCTIGWGVGGLPPGGSAGAPQCSLCGSQTISGFIQATKPCDVTFQKPDERGLEPMPTPESPPNVALPSDESLRAELDAYHPPAEPFCYAHLSQKNNGSNEDGDNVRDLWLRARKCSIEGYTVPLYKNNMLQENNTPDLLQENNTLRETVAKLQQVAESNAQIMKGMTAVIGQMIKPAAQTADARDTERWRALRGACESLIAASEEYDFDDGFGVGILQDAWDEFQTAVDAAEIDPEPDALAIMKTAIAAIQRDKADATRNAD